MQEHNGAVTTTFSSIKCDARGIDMNAWNLSKKNVAAPVKSESEHRRRRLGPALPLLQNQQP